MVVFIMVIAFQISLVTAVTGGAQGYAVTHPSPVELAPKLHVYNTQAGWVMEER